MDWLYFVYINEFKGNKESAPIKDDFLVTSQGPIELLVQATKTFLQETSNKQATFIKELTLQTHYKH